MSARKATNDLHVCKSSTMIHAIWFQLVNSGDNRQDQLLFTELDFPKLPQINKCQQRSSK